MVLIKQWLCRLQLVLFFCICHRIARNSLGILHVYRPIGIAMNSVSTNDIVNIMDAGLGDPPDLPPGCVQLFSGCLHALSDMSDKKRAAFALQHREFIVKWMCFLTAYRSKANFKRLYETLMVCRCDTGPEVLRRAPKALHTLSPHTGGRPNMLMFLNIFFERICQFIPAIEGIRLRALYKPSNLTWPAHPSDLMPYIDQPIRSVHMLASWSFVRHITGAPVYTFARLFNELIQSLRAHMVPGLLKTPAVWDWLADLVRCSMIELRKGSMQAQAMFALLQQSASLVSYICDAMFDDELIVWATSDGERSLARVCEFASDGMVAIQAAYHYRRKNFGHDHKPGSAQAEERTRGHFAELALRILRARPLVRNQVRGSVLAQ
jgi:hypothetical protein